MLGKIAFRFIACAAAIAAAGSVHAQDLSERIRVVTEQRAAQQQLPKGALLRALLGTKVSVRFQETPAKEAFEYLERLMGIDLTVRWSSDRVADGFDPEAPLTLEVSNGVALAVMERMIEAVATDPSTWQLRDGFVEVGPKSRLNARTAQETRIYPIRDLLFEAPMFDNAPEFNLGQALQGGGGAGGGGGFGGGGGGFGGGGGGGFGGGGGGGGAGGGGLPFGESGEAPARRSAEEKAQELIDLIQGLVEPDAWLDESVASIRYYDGSIIVRAPDYIQRQIGGYGAIPMPPARRGGRYVDLSPSWGVTQVNGFATAPVTGAAGGGGGTGGNFIPSGGAAPPPAAPPSGAPTSDAPATPPQGPGTGDSGKGSGTGRKGAGSSTP